MKKLILEYGGVEFVTIGRYWPAEFGHPAQFEIENCTVGGVDVMGLFDRIGILEEVLRDMAVEAMQEDG